MAKKSNYWYVLVMTDEGPKFVTSLDCSTKYAHYDKLEKPLEMSKSQAQDLATGLTLNFNLAFAVCQRWEITDQPYLYSKGNFKWVSNEEEDEEDE